MQIVIKRRSAQGDCFLQIFKWLAPTILVLTAIVLQLFFRNLIGERLFIFVYPMMFIGSLIGPLFAGVFSVVVSTVLAWYFFAPPFYSFESLRTNDLLTLQIFFANGLVANLATELVRKYFLSKQSKLQSDQLKLSEEKFRLLVEGVKDYSIFLLNPDGIVSTWNAGAERISQYSADEIIGKHFSVFYPDEAIFAKLPEIEIDTAIAHGRHESEGWRIKKDGTRFWANVTLTALKNSEGILIGYSKITRDLSERRRAENTLQSANELLELRVQTRTKELQEANLQLQDLAINEKRLAEELKHALSVRDEFLTIASHELRTPITSLKMQIQLAQRGVDLASGRTPPAEKLAKVLEVQDRQADRLATLVDELLDVSKIQSGKLEFNFEVFDLSEMVQDIVDRFEEEFKLAGSRTSLNLQKGIKICADRFRVEQVLVNLLTNALKYGDSKPVEVSAHQVGSMARLEVIDHGLGIAKENLNKIFDRFERAISHHNISGLGLGLYISKEIVAAHSGNINVQSSLHQGSRFTVEIPLSQPHKPAGHKDVLAYGN